MDSSWTRKAFIDFLIEDRKAQMEALSTATTQTKESITKTVDRLIQFAGQTSLLALGGWITLLASGHLPSSEISCIPPNAVVGVCCLLHAIVLILLATIEWLTAQMHLQRNVDLLEIASKIQPFFNSLSEAALTSILKPESDPQQTLKTVHVDHTRFMSETLTLDQKSVAIYNTRNACIWKIALGTLVIFSFSLIASLAGMIFLIQPSTK